MDLRQMQGELDTWVRDNGGYWPPLANLARLTEEVGELARQVNQVAGPKPRKPGEARGELDLEMADVLWVLLCLSNQLDVDLQEAFEATMAKVRARGACTAQDEPRAG